MGDLFLLPFNRSTPRFSSAKPALRETTMTVVGIHYIFAFRFKREHIITLGFRNCNSVTNECNILAFCLCHPLREQPWLRLNR